MTESENPRCGDPGCVAEAPPPPACDECGRPRYKEPASRGLWYGTGVVGAVVFVMWAASYCVMQQWFGPDAKVGEIGDSFGALNALFSGLAFTGVIAALFMQRAELKHQREDLVLTRGEIAGQREQLKAQVGLMGRQGFEGTLFQLLNFHKGANESFFWSGGQGLSAFSGLVLFMQREAKAERGAEGESLKDTWARLSESTAGHLPSYLKRVELIMGFLGGAGEDVVGLYNAIVRAQFSDQELTLIYYYCASGAAGESFCFHAGQHWLFAGWSPEGKILPELVKEFAVPSSDFGSTDPSADGGE